MRDFTGKSESLKVFSSVREAAMLMVHIWPLRSSVVAGGRVSFSSPKAGRNGDGVPLVRCGSPC